MTSATTAESPRVMPHDEVSRHLQRSLLAGLTADSAETVISRDWKTRDTFPGRLVTRLNIYEWNRGVHQSEAAQYYVGVLATVHHLNPEQILRGDISTAQPAWPDRVELAVVDNIKGCMRTVGLGFASALDPTPFTQDASYLPGPTPSQDSGPLVAAIAGKIKTQGTALSLATRVEDWNMINDVLTHGRDNPAVTTEAVNFLKAHQGFVVSQSPELLILMNGYISATIAALIPSTAKAIQGARDVHITAVNDRYT